EVSHDESIWKRKNGSDSKPDHDQYRKSSAGGAGRTDAAGSGASGLAGAGSGGSADSAIAAGVSLSDWLLADFSGIQRFLGLVLQQWLVHRRKFSDGRTGSAGDFCGL